MCMYTYKSTLVAMPVVQQCTHTLNQQLSLTDVTFGVVEAAGSLRGW